MCRFCGLNVCPNVIRLFHRNENKNKTFSCAQDSHFLALCLEQNILFQRLFFVHEKCCLLLSRWRLFCAICEWSDKTIRANKAWKQRLCLIVFWKLKSHFVSEFDVLVLHWSQFCSEQNLTQTKERHCGWNWVKESFEMNEN